ncbi:hypothetical protein JKG47_17885 [Acidithiobacillus sp. MC6.1]|nr:hypothetical protein [Acidithiobacillus sp. MC6.1]
MKTVIFSHGDKGGVGKSAVAAIMVDMILKHKGQCGVIDGDVKTSDIYNRYKDTDGADVIKLQLNYAGAATVALNKLSEQVDSSNENAFIVVNCPAGAGDTLDELAELFNEACDMDNTRMVASYALGTKEECAGALAESLKNGLMSFVIPDNRMILYPLMQGERSAFPWETDSAKATYKGGVGDIPALTPSFVMQALEKIRGPLSNAVGRDDIGLTRFARVSVKHWLADCESTLMPLLFPKDKDGGDQDDAA